ncbi:MAG TPA: ABC transporter permease subunit [Kofleriaceae bacterium]|nr:ABC transporter permease subunit [Kofleriaceae bacterium]
MAATSIIYRRELGAYLRSPFAWVIAAVLLLVDGIFFRGFVLPGQNLSAIVLERYFYWSSGVAMAAGLLLSFRLIAEERTSNSIVLLTTSPVRDSQIIIGKFLAALTFLAILLVMSIYMPLLIKVRGKITYSQIMVGYLGLLLVGSAALSIGLFASSMVKNQVLSAVIGLAILIVMVFLYQFAKTLDGTVKDVLQEVDLWWIHFQNGFMRGVLNLKDLIYYLAVIYLFLLLSVKTLEAKRWQ